MKIKFSPRLTIGLLITLFFAIALFIRVYFPYDQVFVGDWVKYTGNDAYYQMRLVDNMVQNFPNITDWDPYLIYPNGSAYGDIHFFNYLLAFVIWLFTFGSPTPHAVDLIGVYFPAVLAALTVIPVFFIGKALFNRWAGVIAAGIMSVMPGEYLGRSILGGTDQHVAETLFIAIAAMFTIYALKSGFQNQLSLSSITKLDWKAIRKPLIFSILAGVFLGVYMITWIGALIFVFIFLVYVIIQIIIDHLKGHSGFYLGFTSFFISLVALLIFLPVATGFMNHKLALVATMFLPLIMALVSQFMTNRKWNTVYYPALLIVVAVVFVFVLRAVNPAFFNTVTNQFASVFNPGGPTGATTIEMQPFLSPMNELTTQVAYGNFTSSFFLIPSNLIVEKIRWVPIWELILLGITVWLWLKQGKENRHKLLFQLLSGLLFVAAVVFYFAAPPEWKLWVPGLAFISIVWLIVLFFKNGAKDKHLLFFVVFTIIMLVATLTQRRFAYYLVINMAILSSYLCWLFIWWFSKRRNRLENPETLREQYKRSALLCLLGGIFLNVAGSIFLRETLYFLAPMLVLSNLIIFAGFWSWIKMKNKSEWMIFWVFLLPIGAIVLALSKDESVKSSAAKKVKAQSKLQPAEQPGVLSNPWLYAFNIITLVLIVFMAVFWPNWDKAKGVASAATYAPSDGWEEALHWLKDNSPEPLPEGSYYELYDVPAGGKFDYPDTAYGVTSWWDYGYWITRTAHRIPNANPSQSPLPIRNVANLFLSADLQQAEEIIDALDSSYIILDDTLTTSKFWAIATWAGVNLDNYVSTFYYQGTGNQVIPIDVYSPDYYKLLSVRLFNFDGKASASEKPMILTWEERSLSNGNRIRLITAADEFDSYQAALNFVAANPDKNLHIAGQSPFMNPIPIEAVTDYELVFSSTQQLTLSDNNTTSTVKVFKYLND